MTAETLPYRRSDVPEGISGDWIIERFEVPAPAVDRPDLRPDWAQTLPGWYTRLRRGPEVFMTDSHDEWWTQRTAIDEARQRGGFILITGLGLGLVIEEILGGAESVRKLTVVEQSPDVLQLVGPHLQSRYGDRLEIVCADAFTWIPPDGLHYSVAWHDIWPNPRDPACATQIERLQTRYASWCDWQGSWTTPD